MARGYLPNQGGGNVTPTNIPVSGLTIPQTYGLTDALETPRVDVQTFAADGVWKKPAGATVVSVALVSGGGGGGSGRRGAAATVRCGGGGGGGGAMQAATIPADLLPSTVNVTVGVGGAGGAAVTADDTNGNVGIQGTASLFGSYVRSGFAGPGAGGTNAAGTGGFASSGALASGGGGAAASTTGGVGGNATAVAGAAGGGAGGGITTANAAANGGRSSGFVNGNGGVVAGTAPTNPGNAAGAQPATAGGGGGASSITGNAQAGAAGALYGGGGGGGGAATNGVGTSGAGGNGGAGVVQVVTFVHVTPKLIRPSGPTVPAAGLTLLGAGTSDTGTDFDLFMSTSEQNTVSTWSTFMTEGGTFAKAITDHQAVTAKLGTEPTLEIAWGFPGTQGLAGIAAGVDDAYILARADELAAYDAPVLLRLNWEMNGYWYNWSAFTQDGTPIAGRSQADYIAAWRHIVTLIRSRANRVGFVWCPHLWVLPNSAAPDTWYPGDGYVDWVATNAYAGAAVWSYIQDGLWGLNDIAQFADTHGKPMRICEWAPGVANQPVGDFYTFRDWILATPAIREIVYFHQTDHTTNFSYRLAEFPEWAFAYRSVFTSDPARYPQSREE